MLLFLHRCIRTTNGVSSFSTSQINTLMTCLTHSPCMQNWIFGSVYGITRMIVEVQPNQPSRKQTSPYFRIFMQCWDPLHLPVTTCECERSVSALCHLKTHMRTSVGQERLNGLALLLVHNTNEAWDIFARKHARQLTLVDILNSDWKHYVI